MTASTSGDTTASVQVPAPSQWKFAALFFGLCLAVLCQALDNTILATAIPKITDEFNSLSDIG